MGRRVWLKAPPAGFGEDRLILIYSFCLAVACRWQEQLGNNRDLRPLSPCGYRQHAALSRLLAGSPPLIGLASSGDQNETGARGRGTHGLPEIAPHRLQHRCLQICCPVEAGWGWGQEEPGKQRPYGFSEELMGCEELDLHKACGSQEPLLVHVMNIGIQ